MKRYLLFVVAAMLCLPMVAQESIQRTFFGCELGKTSRKECVQKMLKLGAQMQKVDDTNLIFSGELVFLADTLTNVMMGFSNDTLLTVLIADTLGYRHSENVLATKVALHAYYENHTSWRDDIVAQSTLSTFLSVAGIDSTGVWGRSDMKTLVAEFSGDSPDRLALIFINIASLWESLYQGYRKTTPDYDSANEVKGVAGCNFGESKQSVMAKFRLRSESLIEDKGQYVLFYKVSMGGNTFNRARLYFKEGKFISCCFETEFYTWKKDEARSLYKILCDQYSRKYTNATLFDKDQEKLFSTYGMLQSDYEGGEMPPIVISCEKSLSAGGDYYYYVTVSYFSGRVSTLYDDEI